MKTVIAAGGTGGHLFPAQQLAHKLKEKSEIVLAGHQISSSAYCSNDFPVRDILAAPLKKSFRSVARFSQVLVKGLCQSYKLLSEYNPDVVVGFGSFHTFPVLLAAAFLGKKIVLFEANCLLGKVNRFFTPFAERVAFQFSVSSSLSKKEILVPLLPWKEVENSFVKEQVLQEYGLDPLRATVLVFGGSLGSSFLNRFVPQALRGKDLQVIHLGGHSANLEEIRARYSKDKVRAYVTAFETQMEKAYSAANFAICRAGASTIAELIQFQLPALLIPYPYSAQQHQKSNAEFLVKKRAARIFLETTSLELMDGEIDHVQQEISSLREHLKQLNITCANRTSLEEVVLGFKRKA